MALATWKKTVLLGLVLIFRSADDHGDGKASSELRWTAE
jgi:hypothetical protein